MALRRDLLERSRQMRARERTTTLILFLLIPPLLCVLFVVAMRRPELLVQEVAIDGVDTLAPGSVRLLVEQELSHSFLWVIPRRNRFFIPKDRIVDRITQEYGQVSDVYISVGFSRTVRVVINEYQPEYLSCVGSSCYYMTRDGFRYAEAPVFSNTRYIRFTGGTTTVRAHIIDPALFSDIVRVIDTMVFPREGERIVSVDITPEDDAIATTQTGYELRWDNDTRPQTVVEQFQLAYESPDFAQRFAVSADTLEYIDARFGKKVFYRFRDEQE